MNGIPSGISASIGLEGPPAWAVKKIAETYLSFTKNTAGVEHRAASDSFHNNRVQAPSLWFYSEADPVANPADCRKVISNWKGRGTIVEECVWENTPHIQHGRIDPERYFGCLGDFLTRHGVTDQ
jgi:hypothetical protein